jgi:hypothetical protein
MHSFEDFCRAKNAFLKKDDIVLRDNVLNVTTSAANVVAALNEKGFARSRDLQSLQELQEAAKELLKDTSPEVRPLIPASASQDLHAILR